MENETPTEARTFEVKATEMVHGRHIPITLVVVENPKTQQLHLVGSMSEPAPPAFVVPSYSPEFFPRIDPSRMRNIGDRMLYLYPDLQAHLRAVIDYNWDDELTNFFECPCKGHIFEDLVALRNLLDGTKRSAESWIDKGETLP